jgi:hypothetical protein
MASSVPDRLTPRAREIVTAGRELLEQEGPEALSMRRVAQSLGIRHAIHDKSRHRRPIFRPRQLRQVKVRKSRRAAAICQIQQVSRRFHVALPSRRSGQPRPQPQPAP